MTAYNRFRGVPCSANDYLINDILRGEWGYKGLVVSDCWAISDFFEEGCHDYSANEAAAAAAAANAGVEVECGSSYRSLPEAVRSGLLKEEVLDRNLLHVLTERFRLGDFDRESPWDKLDTFIVEGPGHRALALKAAHESMVLLQNNGVLPLASDAKVALLGPNADDAAMQWGNYNPIPKSTVTLLQAMRERVPDLFYDSACPRVSDGIPADLQGWILDSIDVVVFAGGISPQLEGEEMPVSVPGFSGGDRTSIALPAIQGQILKALHDAGKKVVLVNFSGSAIGLEEESQWCDAILQAWYPGQEGGTAVADVLYGDVNPSGKLPVTFYKDVSQLPDVEDYNMEGHTYRYFRGEPQWPFGFGLSYTAFSFGDAAVKGGNIVIPVTNTGSVDGAEVVQLYVRRPDDAEGPVKTLRGFKRVNIPAGKTVKVKIPLTLDTFTWWDGSDMTPLPGRYELMYGGSSADLKTLTYDFRQ